MKLLIQFWLSSLPPLNSYSSLFILSPINPQKMTKKYPDSAYYERVFEVAYNINNILPYAFIDFEGRIGIL
jgi:hypothetical protein